MQSSLTKGPPFTLVCSTRLPVSVCGTVTTTLLRGFSRQLRLIIVEFDRSLLLPLTSQPRPGHFSRASSAYRLGRSADRKNYLPASSLFIFGQTAVGGTGISTSCPSAFAFTYALGPTNPKRINLASETLDFRCACFSQAIRYSYRHSHL